MLYIDKILTKLSLFNILNPFNFELNSPCLRRKSVCQNKVNGIPKSPPNGEFVCRILFICIQSRDRPSAILFQPSANAECSTKNRTSPPPAAILRRVGETHIARPCSALKKQPTNQPSIQHTISHIFELNHPSHSQFATAVVSWMAWQNDDQPIYIHQSAHCPPARAQTTAESTFL